MGGSGDEAYFRLNHKALQIGDVLVESGSSKFGSLIRFVERRPFTHALVCLGGAQVVEAVARGVVLLSAVRVVTREPGRYRHLRYPGLTDAQRGVIEDVVRCQAFKNYSLRGALGTKAAPIRTRKVGDKFFCSELVTIAYAKAGIDLIPGRKLAAITPNMFLGGDCLLADVTGSDLFERVSIESDDDRREAEKMLDRDEHVRGTEVDDNRRIEQEMVRAFGGEIRKASNYPDGKRRRASNLVGMLSALVEMHPEKAVLLSDRLDEAVRTAGYFDLAKRTVARSHIPIFETEFARLWFSDRRAEAMEYIEQCHELAVLYRSTVERLRTDAAKISSDLEARLSVFRSIKEMLFDAVAVLEDYCSRVERMKRIKDLASP